MAEIQTESKWRNRIVGYSEVDPKTLVPNPKNWRVHPKNQKDAMQGALDDVGWVADITINQNTGRVVDGHLRLDLALQNNEQSVPVKIVDLTEEEEEKVLASLDPISAMAKTDKAKLAAILEHAKAGNQNMIDLLEALRQRAGMTVFRKPEPRPLEKVETTIERGQVFQLGSHRVMCGDSTCAEDVVKLLGGEVPTLVFTSPPYNAGATPTEAKYGKKSKYADDNDAASQGEYTRFLNDFTSAWLRNCVYLFVNIQHIAGNKVSVIEWLHTWKYNYADKIVWDKQWAPPAMSDNVLDSQFEEIFIFKEETPASRRIGSKKFRGVVKNVYSAPSQKNNEFSGVHNATFPQHLPDFIITNFTNTGEVVADPFLGTGTTLISATEHGRTCYGMELDPGYLELSIQQWERMTGCVRELVK